ncbi:MAG: prepilin-type N-terminal cleavage/methylation domain-containing protein [Patescibacteria group bacterium]|nr:prepilin-type N-terminal cleavage/methylation domain-containing protein [Patescibacteria group bacterium]
MMQTFNRFKKEKNFTRHSSKRAGGFTLIELLVVVTIIGLLSTMVLTSLNTARIKARDVRRLSDIRQVALGLEMYYDDNVDTGYPGTSGSNQWGVMKTTIEDSGYITSIPSDPGVNDYEYWVAPDNRGYVLNATIEKAENPALDNDFDGTDVFGCDCTDPEYCIKM